MREQLSKSSTTENPKAERHYPVHIGTVTHQYLESEVEARRILTDFGFTPPEQYVLERIRHDQAVGEYAPGDSVPLDRPEDNRFRAVPVGGGRA